MEKTKKKNMISRFYRGAAVVAFSCAVVTSSTTFTNATTEPSAPATLAAPAQLAAVDFDFYPAPELERLVRDTWKNHPDYKKIWDKLQLLPDHAIGLYDLNGDGKPEIFVRQSEPRWGFCDKRGFACRLQIYVNTPQGLVEIGDMMSADPVRIMANKSNGLNNIRVGGPDDVNRTYRWDGKKYAQP